MTVEIDISDIPLKSFYTDERCKRVEKIIQGKEEYTEFRVKRYRSHEDTSLDIYVIMDATENYWVWMFEWEIDALTDSEVLAYIIFTKETSQRPDSTENWRILMSLFIALTLTIPFLVLLVRDIPINEVIIGIVVVSLIGAFASGWKFKGKREEHMKSEREFEIELMKQYPLFLESIRKFATLPEIIDSQREKYRKLLHEVESKLIEQN